MDLNIINLLGGGCGVISASGGDSIDSTCSATFCSLCCTDLFFTDVSTGESHEHDLLPHPTGPQLTRRSSTRSGQISTNFVLRHFSACMAMNIDRSLFRFTCAYVLPLPFAIEEHPRKQSDPQHMTDEFTRVKFDVQAMRFDCCMVLVVGFSLSSDMF